MEKRNPTNLYNVIWAVGVVDRSQVGRSDQQEDKYQVKGKCQREGEGMCQCQREGEGMCQCQREGEGMCQCQGEDRCHWVGK